MKLLFSTKSVHPRDRLAYWREEASKVFVRHEFSTTVGRNFHGEISVASLGGIDLATMAGDPCTVTRTAHCLKSATDDDFILCRQSTGRLRVHQDGRDAGTGPGDVYLLDPRRPFALAIVANSEGVFFKIPRSELEARLGAAANWTATPLPRAKPAASLASEFLVMIAERAAAIDPSMGAKVARQALDLVALAFEARGGRVVQLSSARASTLLRLKSIIETGLHDPALKPAAVAQAAGISVRYANALLAHEGSSLERYIVLRRLQRCHQALESRAHLSRTVGEIAYGFGFSDLSHFTRRFKELYGCSPGEIRPRAGA